MIGVDLPTAAMAHGPFGIRTRAYIDGQIVDTNITFANLYVSAEKPAASALTITPAVGNEADIRTSVSLDFRFTVQNDLWKNDIFVIYTDDDWTLSESPSCESEQVISS